MPATRSFFLAALLAMTSQERYAAHSQLEHLQAKYVGTGHADTTKLCASARGRRPPFLSPRARPGPLTCRRLLARSEWAVNQHRDSYALYVGHDSLASFFAVAENESVGRVKFSCLQVCPPPRRHRHQLVRVALPPPAPLPPHSPICSRAPLRPPRAVQKMIQPCGPPPPKEED